tara:strand:- start:494 stop:1144 length:651 start_codon:yes stop_codon:yes gene_type:complete
MATYLDIVNDVLKRLREPTVTSVDDTDYSRMLSVLVNDSKRDVEDANEWNALSTTLTAITTNGVFNYVLEGSRTRFRVIDVWNDSDDFEMRYASTHWMNRQFTVAATQPSVPSYYNFNGVDINGDTQVDLFPIPDGAHTLRFNLIIPQADLEDSADRILVPSHCVSMLAYSKAIAERGEDSGLTSSEAYQMYRLALADAVAIERNHYPEEMSWESI